MITTMMKMTTMMMKMTMMKMTTMMVKIISVAAGRHRWREGSDEAEPHKLIKLSDNRE